MSLPSGVLCLGGQTYYDFCREVFLLSFDGSKVNIVNYPPLPVAVRNAAVAVIGSKVYLAGGEGRNCAIADFLMIDSNHPDQGRQVLPDLPQPVTGASMVAQMDGDEISLFLIGGRALEPGKLITSFYSRVYHYRPSVGRWTQR